MKGVIYARYSSESQRDESIDGQLRECYAFAEKNGIDIIGEYIDRAFSARTDNRPDFRRMMADCAKEQFDVILVWKLDRFARSRKDSGIYKALLYKHHIKLISATEVISDGPEGVLLESVLEGLAEYYSADLAVKVIRGMTENALKCMYNGGGVPLGYNIDANQFFVVDPIVAPHVLQAFKDYKDGMTILEITDKINLAGVRTKRGHRIDINAVTRMLHNRRYIGEYRYRNIVTPGGIPAIVPEKLFNEVQERMAKNKKAPARHKAEDEYLLTTKLFCGKCQCFMVGECGTSATKQVYHYYKCISAKKKTGCDKKAVKKEWIENLVIEQIKKILLDDELLDKLADMAVAQQEQEDPVLPMLKQQYARTVNGINHFLDAIQQGIITDSTKERLEALEKEKKELSIRIAQEESRRPPVLTKEQCLFWFERLRKLDTKKLEHRRKLIDTFVNAVFVYDDRIVFTFNYKDGSKTITLAELEKSGLGSDTALLGGP